MVPGKSADLQSAITKIDTPIIEYLKGKYPDIITDDVATLHEISAVLHARDN